MQTAVKFNPKATEQSVETVVDPLTAMLRHGVFEKQKSQKLWLQRNRASDGLQTIINRAKALEAD